MKNVPKTVRCAIYTRKSSDENLDSDFSSLDSQREYCEAFIKSQGALGWVCLPDRYDDGGYSGGTLNRPAFKRLLADIDAGKIDAIVAYKYERLSRSLLDFLKLMESWVAKGVEFVSVTQQFNTSTSAGRMSLNIMLSLAQYERENASERTRDKIAAARRKGKWSGGRPILGYDVDRTTKRLLINTEEAQRIREIFRLYLDHEKLLGVVAELGRRGWANKRWMSAKGKSMGGRPFDKCSVFKLLTNTAYMGLVRHKQATYPGEHEAIVGEPTFRRVQDILKRNGPTGGALVRNKYNALLKGLLTCSCCNCSMGHSYSSKGGKMRYSYYLCLNASKSGWNACPGPSVPAGEIERFVIERIATLMRDPQLVAQTVQRARCETTEAIKRLESEQTILRRDQKRLQGELKQVATSQDVGMTSRIAGLNEQIGVIEARLADIARELQPLRATMVTESEVVAAFGRFDELWATLAPREQVQVIRLLVRRVEWDGKNQKIKIVFQPTGLRGLVDRTNDIRQEEAA